MLRQPSDTVSDTGFPSFTSDRGEHMTVDDCTRLNLHRKLEAVLGPDNADTLMAHLPPVTWQDVATKNDLRALESVLRADMATLRAELSGEMAAHRADSRGEMATLGGDLRNEIRQAMERQIRWMVTFNTGLVALALTVARLL
jgi:hypothetical protein